MSKFLRAILLAISVTFLILQLFNISRGQDISAKITVKGRSAIVEGRFRNAEEIAKRRNLPFLKEYADAGGLGERISGVSLTDASGQNIQFKQLIPGELLSSGPFSDFRYQVDLTPRKNRSAAAHISWITEDSGLVFLDDILPQLSGRKTASVTFELPDGWQVYSTGKTTSGSFDAVNIEKAVFVIGKGLRSVAIQGSSIKLVLDGEWQFSDADAAKIVEEIYADYRRILGADPANRIQITVIKFPTATGPGNWEADTRGASVTVLSSDMPFKTQSLQRLHEQLRHEIFHLWIPNGIGLRGNYDWFYEGFALYMSLRSGVLMNRIRFNDYLDTLSRAHTIDSFQNPRLSLIEAARNRWNGGNTTVYARGMIFAFLCDLALLKNSKGKSDIFDVVREIYQKYRGQEKEADGTEAVLSILNTRPELRPVIERYVRGNLPVNWAEDLVPAGIVSQVENSNTVLKVAEKPNNRQKALLDKLGYNSWRKLSKDSK